MINAPFVSEKEQKEVLPKTSKLEKAVKIILALLILGFLTKSQAVANINNELEKYTKGLSDTLIGKGTIVQNAYKSCQIMLNKATTSANQVAKKIPIQPKLIGWSHDMSVEDMWAVAKGSPNVDNYPKRVEDAVKKLQQEGIVTRDDGKKPLPIWQQVELDVRHKAQEEMVDQAKKSGNDLYWLSSHPDCSERCEPWQGKLVSLSLPSKDKATKWTGKVENGNRVYSFTDIENQKDKYGYKNNIINGFNCRHKLILYNKDKPFKPDKYTPSEIERERRINDNLRKMEREIRRLKTEAETTALVNKSKALKLKKDADKLIKLYKEYAEKHGFAWYPYRIEV